jgi:streptogramin lyase
MRHVWWCAVAGAAVLALAACGGGGGGQTLAPSTRAANVGRVLINATTAAGVTEYPVPTANAGLIDLVGGPDGNIWFVENASNRIEKLAL